MANRHVIGKQVFEMEVMTSKNTYALQQEVSVILKNKLNPELENLFNGFAKQEEVWSIDYLEIDLGSINPEKLDTLVDKILSAVESALLEKLKGQLPDKINPKHYGEDGQSKDAMGSKTQSDFQHWKDKNSSASYSEVGKTQHGKQEPLHQGKQALHAYYFKLWLKFLAKGILPSHAIPPEKVLITYALKALVLDNTAVQDLQDLLKKQPMALKRLVLQHRSNDLVSLVEIYTGFSQSKLTEALKDFIKALQKNNKTAKKTSQRSLEVKLWKQLLQQVIISREKLDSKAIVAALKKKPLEETALIMEETTEESSQFFKNAGLVLLHPFIAAFFKKLKFLEKGDFKNNAARTKAVLLLHFLATGEETAPEYELFLPKFICEMPTNMPLDHTLKISKTAKKEALNLLKAAIEHWGALGSSSPGALQEGFLQREGKLEKEQTGWKLYVEQKTLDILLDKLPWNLSMIKLPWMKEILKVEWR